MEQAGTKRSGVEGPIVFFDGVCGLCNRFVDFLFRYDTRGVFRVSALQGELAKDMLGERVASGDFKTILLIDEAGLHEGSTAVLRVLSGLGGVWKVLSWLKVVPRPLRDWVYYWVSKNRYRFFGKRDTCRLPTPSELKRFLP